MESKRLDYIDYFRAIAIIIIVMGHTVCWGRSTMREFNALLFAGGTYFFVFIAGFLFQHLAGRYDTKTYYKKKLINVICPHFVLLFPVAYLFSFHCTQPYMLDHLSNGYRFIATMFSGYIVNGPVWFIGMIAIVFLVSPLILKIKEKNKKIYLTIFLMSFIYSVITTRISSINIYYGITFDNSNLLRFLYISIIYYFKIFFHFIFFYLLGMEIYDLIKKYSSYIKKNLKTIFFISLFLYVFHFIISLFILKSALHREYMSKLIETFVLLSGIMLLEDNIRKNNILDKSLKFVAQYSFGIFFIHGIIINYIFHHVLYAMHGGETGIFIGKNTLRCCFTAWENFLIAFFGSILFLVIVKFILKKLGIKNTRMFIGV